MRTPTVLAPVFVSLVLVAGCGGSDGSDGASVEATTTTTTVTTTTSDPEDRAPVTVSEEEYVAALTTNLSAGDEASGHLVVTDEQAACMAPKWVAAMTVALLQENGVTVEELADPSFNSADLGMDIAQGEAMVAAFDDCDVDTVALFTQSLTQGLSPQQQQCAAEQADPALVAALLTKSFSTGDSDAELVAVISQLQEVCDLPA